MSHPNGKRAQDQRVLVCNRQISAEAEQRIRTLHPDIEVSGTQMVISGRVSPDVWQRLQDIRLEFT